jgi:hypothetical protein
MCCRDVEHIEPASEVLGSVRARELAGVCEHVTEIEHNWHQPLVIEIVSKLLLDRAAFFPRDQFASHEPLQFVRGPELLIAVNGSDLGAATQSQPLRSTAP